MDVLACYVSHFSYSLFTSTKILTLFKVRVAAVDILQHCMRQVAECGRVCRAMILV
jgi:hypothetical protein